MNTCVVVTLASSLLCWLLLLSGCGTKPTTEDDEVVLQSVGYQDMPGWQQDNLADAFTAFKRSCERVLRYPPKETAVQLTASKTLQWQDYQRVCRQLPSKSLSNAEARVFFEKWFVPHRARSAYKKEFFFTGYYIPTIKASSKPTAKFRYPIYARPKDLVVVEDLSIFRPEKHFKNRRIAGRVQGGRLQPYLTREQIHAGKLTQQGLEIAWTSDLVGLFFMQVQGSGVLEMTDGTRMTIGYHGTNGHNYTSIGKVLVERGDIAKADVSMQSIRAWMKKYPQKAIALMHENKSFVFFRPLNKTGVIGSQATELVPMRSVAVDSAHIPLGVPLWIDIPHPKAQTKIQRLVIAQDTGGAIKGPVRSDLFCGFGDKAGELAGVLQHHGQAYMLLPKSMVS